MAYRIDDRTAVSLLPAPKTTGTGQPGFFTAGDPQTGEGATVVTDDWLNMVQEELVGVVQAAGIAPDKTNNGQLKAAILSFLQDKLSGTAGLAPGDTAGVGLHLNHGTGRATFGTADERWRDLAWGSDVDSLSQRVQEGLQTAVSGTYWMGSGDLTGLGLHTNGATGKPAYVDKKGARDLAIDADVQPLLAFRTAASQQIADLSSTALSGTVGLAPGDTAGVGLHVNHASDRPTFGDNTGRWRDLALATDLDSRLPVSSPTASGSVTVNNNGSTIAIDPSTIFNGQLRGQISWGNRSWYPGGDGLIINDRGNYITDAANASGPTTIQRFTAQGSHGNKIAFPQQYVDDNVQAVLLAKDSGGNLFHQVNYFTVDRYGVVPSLNSWTGSGFINEHGLTWMMIVAFGMMA